MVLGLPVRTEIAQYYWFLLSPPAPPPPPYQICSSPPPLLTPFNPSDTTPAPSDLEGFPRPTFLCAPGE